MQSVAQGVDAAPTSPPWLELKKGISSEMVAQFLFPPNKRRPKRIAQFYDKNRPVMDDWYDLMERGIRTEKDADRLFSFLERDPDFYDPYIAISDFAFDAGDEEHAFGHAMLGYFLAVSRIADKNGDWPEVMEWAWLENRHLMRMLHHAAWMLWRLGQPEHAAQILRRILRMNPGDNQGVRDELLAIRMGLDPETWDEEFLVTDGPMAGGVYDGRKVHDWFEKHAKEYPDEFDWLFAKWKEMELN